MWGPRGPLDDDSTTQIWKTTRVTLLVLDLIGLVPVWPTNQASKVAADKALL